jgi:hypothetical protein
MALAMSGAALLALGTASGATEATGTVTSEAEAVVNEVRLAFDHDGDPASPVATVTGTLRFGYPEGSDRCVLAVNATLTGTITDDRGELSGTAEVTTTYKDARNDALCALEQGEPLATEPWSATWVGTLITGDLGRHRFELQAPARASGGGAPPPTTTTATTVAAANRPPRIEGLSCSPNPATTVDEIVCKVTATDPDGEPLFYDWTVDGQAQLAETASTVWTDPPAGTHTITVTVYEFLGESVTRSVTVTVNPAGTAEPVVPPTEADTVAPEPTTETTVSTVPASAPVVAPATTVAEGLTPTTSSASTVVAPGPAVGPTALGPARGDDGGGIDPGQVGATSAALALSALVVLAGSGVGPGAAGQSRHVQGALDDPARSASLLQRPRPSTELTAEQRRALRQAALEGLAAGAAHDLVRPKVDRALEAVHKKLWGASAPAVPLKVTTDLVTGMKDRERRAPLALRYWLLKRSSPLLLVTDVVGERRVRRALSWVARRLGLNRPRRR